MDVKLFSEFIFLVGALLPVSVSSLCILPTEAIRKTFVSFLIETFGSSTIACVVFPSIIVSRKLSFIAVRYNIDRSFTPSIKGTVVI